MGARQCMAEDSQILSCIRGLTRESALFFRGVRSAYPFVGCAARHRESNIRCCRDAVCFYYSNSELTDRRMSMMKVKGWPDRKFGYRVEDAVTFTEANSAYYV